MNISTILPKIIWIIDVYLVHLVQIVKEILHGKMYMLNLGGGVWKLLKIESIHQCVLNYIKVLIHHVFLHLVYIH